MVLNLGVLLREADAGQGTGVVAGPMPTSLGPIKDEPDARKDLASGFGPGDPDRCHCSDNVGLIDSIDRAVSKKWKHVPLDLPQPLRLDLRVGALARRLSVNFAG